MLKTPLVVPEESTSMTSDAFRFVLAGVTKSGIFLR